VTDPRPRAWNSTLPAPSKPMGRSKGLAPVSVKGKSAPRKKAVSGSGRAESFPPAMAALIDARDPWCIHCGSPRGLQRHHRRIRGYGGVSRPHTHCACDGVRLCILCHVPWAHTAGRREAEAEGLIIPRATVEPWTLSVLVHLDGDRGGMRKYPTCDGRWADDLSEVAALCPPG